MTEMTSPEFNKHIRHAVAVITVEGGALGHLGTLSRELKVPCIVGIKDATKLLKTGNLVEVDAHTGVVKILETK